MINYNEPLYRPPAEANSVIIQVTLGCSFNKCSFCTMYESKEFKQRSLKEIFVDMDIMSKYYPEASKMFLADGDALVLPTNILVEILRYAYSKFSKLKRVSLYASAFNINKKTKEELILLRKEGLSLVYYGIESGSYKVLKKIQKPISKEKMISSLNKLYEVNIKSSVTVILGLAGKKYSQEHIKESAEIINQTKVTYLSTLQLMLEKNNHKKFIKNFDDFEVLNEKEMLLEQKLFIKELNPQNNVIFRSNHVSNSLPLKGTLPKSKEKLLNEIDFVINYYFK